MSFRMTVSGAAGALCLALACAAVVASEVGTGTGATANAPPVTPKVAKVRFAAGELLVKFKGVTPAQWPARAESAEHALAALPPAALPALALVEGEVLRASRVPGLVHIRFQGGMSVAEAAGLLERSGSVAYAEPNYRLRGARVGGAEGDGLVGIELTPNDPRFAQQWGLHNTGQPGGETDADIDAPEGWEVRTNATGAIVAVLGTGIDYAHPDLAGNLWHNPGETCGDEIDNDSNGYVDDCYGIDAYLNTGDPIDEHGMGTHLAGVVGARGNNGIGVAGVGWQAQLMALRFLDAEGWGWVADAVQCLDYALDMKTAQSYPRMVIVSDLVGDRYSKALYDILTTAQTDGVLVVSGAGNGNQNTDVWPYYLGAYDLANIINVSGSSPGDYRQGYNYGGLAVDLAAPGQDILSTWITNTYRLQSGTTPAAGFVAGAAALVWSQTPTMNWKQVKALILNGAEDGLHWGFYNGYNLTEGRLNLANSLTSALNADPGIFAITPPVTNTGETITITGINFGAAAGSITFKGYTLPEGAIVSWANERVVASVPAACPTGYGRLTLTVPAGTARGAFFQVGAGPNPSQWVYPTYLGATILEHEEAAYAQVGNNVWIFGGRSNYGVQTDVVERYSLLTLRGEVRPEWEMPMGLRQAGAAAIGNKVYVVGGYDDETGKYQSMLQIFDTVNGTWSRGRNLPQPLSMPAVVNNAGKLWVFGGHSPNNTGLRTSYVYDPATNLWQAKAQIPLKRAYAGVAIPTAGKIWLVGGYTESGGSWYRTKDVLVYTVASNTWEIRDDIPLNGEHAAAGVINIGSKVFALYGDGDYSAGEWLRSAPWVRNIAYVSGVGTYTPMLGKSGTTVYVISGSRARSVWKIQSP